MSPRRRPVPALSAPTRAHARLDAPKACSKTSNKMKVCIQGADLETHNMGVSALTVCSIQVVMHSHPGAQVYILSYEKSPKTYTVSLPGRQVRVPLVNMRYTWRFWLSNNIAFLLFLTALMKVVPFAGLRRRWIAGNNCLRHLDESDLVLAISGGDSFSDIYGLARMIYVALPQILALWAGKRLILLPQTLGPFKSRGARAIARYIMRRAEAVYSRDRAGVSRGPEMARLNGNAAKLRFCYDVGFLLDPIPPAQTVVDGIAWPSAPPTLLVGLNVSGLLFMGGYNRNNMFGLKFKYSEFIYQLIDYLTRIRNAAVLLIPHVFGTHDESDSAVCERLFAELRDKYPVRLGVVRGRYNQSEIKYLIGRCDFFIGSRMHACIAAVSQDVPAVCLAYSDKFIGVMETVGAGVLVADPRKMNEGAILQAIGQAVEQGAALREQLEARIPQVKETVLGLLKELESRSQGSEVRSQDPEVRV